MTDEKAQMVVRTAWMLVIAKWLAGGLGAGLGAASVLLVVSAYRADGHSGWNRDAVRPVATQVQWVKWADDQFQRSSSGVAFNVDLRNATHKDITISQDIVVMQAAKGTHALHDSVLRPIKDYWIPAGHTVSITLDNLDLCAPDGDQQPCFDGYFKDDDEILLMDRSGKYEIHIPITQLRVPGTGVSPSQDMATHQILKDQELEKYRVR